jgi:hypothetical protein
MNVASTILDALRFNSMKTSAIADETGFEKHSLACAIKRLHRLKLIHIGDWESAIVAVWAYGPGEDALRPDRKTAMRAKELERKPTGCDDLLAMYHMLPIQHNVIGRIHRLATEQDIKEETP